jgi:hypothetical protein
VQLAGVDAVHNAHARLVECVDVTLRARVLANNLSHSSKRQLYQPAEACTCIKKKKDGAYLIV